MISAMLDTIREFTHVIHVLYAQIDAGCDCQCEVCRAVLSICTAA